MWFLIFALVFCELSSGQRFQEDPSAIYFPGPVSRSEERIISNNSTATLRSLQIAKKMNSLHSLEDYLAHVEGLPTMRLSTRTAERLRLNAVKPKPAFCIPEDQVVPVMENPNPLRVYIPNCIRVKRCGGCCNHKLLTCQPVETKMTNFEITVASPNDSNENPYSYRFIRKTIVPIEEHTQCDCLCTVKEEDCNEKQEYLPDECGCQCKNFEEREKCKASDGRKTWNPHLCACECQEVKQCPTKFDFDPNTCSCKELAVPPWLTENRKTDYSFSPSRNSRDRLPLYISLDASDPRRRPKEDPER